eukprot:TRINITY_DN65631_c0_g1_i1.p1 TRINITY_DN65631_c0_g1~~TRINITY_DN65631_c0_g1_i1.p1  ORF type:complete len:360 (-),score=58.60 TRINITY_DN65631_c0_g1_i1:9-1088(-)
MILPLLKLGSLFFVNLYKKIINERLEILSFGSAPNRTGPFSVESQLQSSEGMHSTADKNTNFPSSPARIHDLRNISKVLQDEELNITDKERLAYALLHSGSETKSFRCDVTFEDLLSLRGSAVASQQSIECSGTHNYSWASDSHRISLSPGNTQISILNNAKLYSIEEEEGSREYAFSSDSRSATMQREDSPSLVLQYREQTTDKEDNCGNILANMTFLASENSKEVSVNSQQLGALTPIKKVEIDEDSLHPDSILSTPAALPMAKASPSGRKKLFYLQNSPIPQNEKSLVKDFELSFASGIFEENKELNIILSPKNCLLYTSDAADDTPCVDLGGRRIIKKKKSKKKKQNNDKNEIKI